MDQMTIPHDVRIRLEANGHDCGIDEAVDLCPDLTWNQIFLAIDHLSRTGQIRLRRDQTGRYTIQLSPSS